MPAEIAVAILADKDGAAVLLEHPAKLFRLSEAGGSALGQRLTAKNSLAAV
jgi:hypothetical protein